MLFLTLDARMRFSIDERFFGDGEFSRKLFSYAYGAGEPGSRSCQYRRVDVAPPDGL